MTDLNFYFGTKGSEGIWYLKTGTTGFTPININALPGPKPTFQAISNQMYGKVTGDVWDDDLVFGDKVLMDTQGDTIVIDVVGKWNTVKDMQLKSTEGQSLYVDGIVHVDLQLGYKTDEASDIFLNGIKRANIITGNGDDVIELRICADANSVWQDDFRIATFGGNDFLRIAPLDVEAELAAGDKTYTESVNKPGIPLLTSGEGRNAHIDMGAGNDTFIGYNTNDHITAGTDDGDVEFVYENSGPSGLAYAIGGATSGGHQSILYSINLNTGAATEIGTVSITDSKGHVMDNLDVESLSLNPNDGYLYGFVTTTGNVAGLVKVDPATAATTFIGGDISDYKSTLQDFAFDSDGTLYLISEGDLLKVSTTTGDVTIVGDDTLSKKIGAVAIDPTSGELYGLSQEGSKTVVTHVDKTDGTVISSFEVSGLPTNTGIEGMGFDSDGTLWAEDRVSGKIYTIDLSAHDATLVSTTLGASDQTGDAFENLVVDSSSTLELVDIRALGGDLITTDGGFDHLFYAAGDGVDTVTDFDVLQDTLHITGYTATDIELLEFNGDTIILFKDASPDGYVDHAMIELENVTGFTTDMISFMSASEYYAL